MSAFDIAVEETVDPQEWVKFNVGKKECLALAQPTAGQVAYVALMSRRRNITESEEFGAMLNFLDSLLHDDTHAYLMDEVLLNPKVKNADDILIGILKNLMEFWSARPTEQPSDSLPSPGPTGTPSTPTTQESTSSDSPAIVSAPTSNDGSSETPTQTIMSA